MVFQLQQSVNWLYNPTLQQQKLKQKKTPNKYIEESNYFSGKGKLIKASVSIYTNMLAQQK